MPGAKRAMPFLANEMSDGRGLYTPDILSAAMELTKFPWDEALPLQGSARSRSCGSVIEIALRTDAGGRIAQVGIKPHACAVGQAAASRFARAVIGRDLSELRATRAALSGWLKGEADLPDWPGIELLEPARAFPARHGAILLAWDAAISALE